MRALTYSTVRTLFVCICIDEKISLKCVLNRHNGLLKHMYFSYKIQKKKKPYSVNSAKQHIRVFSRRINDSLCGE